MDAYLRPDDFAFVQNLVVLVGAGRLFQTRPFTPAFLPCLFFRHFERGLFCNTPAFGNYPSTNVATGDEKYLDRTIGPW